MDRLYVITRGDLSPGAKAAQLGHGLVEFLKSHPEDFWKWNESSNTLVYLEVPKESDLHSLRRKAIDRRVRFAEFSEPDLNFELTAIALEPSARSLIRSIPLAFYPK